MTDRSVSVSLRAKVDGYTGPMAKAADATENVKDKVDQATHSHAAMTRAAQIVGTIGAGAMVLGAKQMIDSASNLSETLNKTSVVFGDNAAEVLDWSKTTAQSMGMSRQQAAEAAATFGNLFVAMRLGTKPAADMSTSLVQLAGDLASFNNTNPADALDALRSGLVGETEPLRRYGVNLTEATLQQKAMEMGLISHKTNALDPAIRAQAAYAMILDQTKTAQGDFARTSDGLANSQRRFTAEVSNAEAALGTALLPTMNTGVHLLTDFLGAFNALPGPVQEVVVITGMLGAGLLILAPRIVATKAALTELGGASGVAKSALGSVTGILGGPWGLAITAGITALALFASKSDVASGAQNDFASALDAANGALDANVRKTVAKAAEDAGLLELAHQMGISTQTVTDAIMGNAAAQKELADATRPSTTAMGEFQQTLAGTSSMFDQTAKGTSIMSADAQTLTGGIGQLSTAFQAASGSATRVAGATGTASDATADLTVKTTTAVSAVDQLKTAIDKLRGTQMSADEATANLEAAIDAATSSIKDNGKTLDEHTAKGRANKAALQGIARAALDGVSAWQANGASARQVRLKTEEARDAFIDAAGKMGLGTKAANRLADAYGLIPAKVSTSITASTATAQSRLNTLLATLNALRQAVHIDVRAQTQGTGGGRQLQGNAGGGLITGPGTKTSDSIVRRVSTGEFVQQASAVDKYGVDTMNAINAGTWSPSMTIVPVPAGGGAPQINISGDGIPVQLVMPNGDVLATTLLQVRRSRGGVALGIG